MDQIAVLLNESSEVATLEDKARIVVFEKTGAEWLAVKEIPNHIDFLQSLSSIRDNLQQLIVVLGDCRIIVGKTISGVVYHVFDKMAFDIFEIGVFAPDRLDGILEDIQHELKQKEEASNHINIESPIETDIPGIYFLDLIALQKYNPDFSSKKALLPFLDNTPFMQLDVVCGHLPPWMEKLEQEKNLSLKVEKLSEAKVKVTVTKNCCK